MAQLAADEDVEGWLPASVAHRHGRTHTSTEVLTADTRTTRLPRAASRSASAGEPVGVDVQHGGPGHGLLEDLGLGGHDAVERLHPLEVHGPDVHDGGRRRLHPPAHRADLARPERAHLGHEHLGARREVLVQRAGQATGVVEAGRAGQHRARPGGEVPQVHLRGGLAVRAR